jgi:integrase
VQLLSERRSMVSGDGPVFPDSVGGYRDRQNVERAFRVVREGTEFDWVVPHTYRKTVATLMDRGGLTARTIADQLGHSRISLTQDVYLGRRAVDGSASLALEELIRRRDLEGEAGLFPPLSESG